MMKCHPVNILEKLSLIRDCWSPRIVAEFNDIEVKLARIHGEYVWHIHENTDEVFMVIEGEFEMHFKDRIEKLAKNDLVVVPSGIEHKPVATDQCSIMLLERSGTTSTGNAKETDTIKSTNGEWI